MSSLTTLAPLPPHKTIMRRCFPWSGGFDCIFRNEEVGGSNPPSSTKCPGQGVGVTQKSVGFLRSRHERLHRRPTRFAL
jgi:hypothetical protein